MKCSMLLCDRAVGQVPRQGAVVGQWVATGVKTRGCHKTPEPRQGGCREDKGCLGAVVGFYKCAQRMHTWRHRCSWGPIGIGNMF